MMRKKLLISDKRSIVFCTIVLINFIMVLAYNILTPYMSDDLWYDHGVMRSLSEIIRDQIEDHMTWSGRDVAHLILKISFCFPKAVFNIVNSLMYVTLSVLAYLNIEGKKKWDFCLYGIIMLLMWFYVVDFDQTILWVSGACNYLWTGTIILGFVTVYRLGLLNASKEPHDTRTNVKIVQIAGMFILGLLAGWGNENTSGGAILLVLILLIDAYIRRKREDREFCSEAWSIVGIVGAVIGLILMVTAPGNRIRGAERIAEEEQTGLMALLGRLLKINDAVLHNFGVLLCIIILLSVYLILKGKSIYDMRYVFIYAGIALITSYVLILTAVPMDRALFGGGILLIIASVQAVVYIPNEDIYMNSIKYSLMIIAVLYLSFEYLSCGADLMRIIRELDERQQMVDEEKRVGNYDLELPMLTEEWNNRFTFIYHYNDITEETDSYGNEIYKVYYDLNSVRGVRKN